MEYYSLLISITGEGANIMTRSLIIYGQAMTRCHPYIAKLMASATDNDVEDFDQHLWKSVGSSLQNTSRAAWLSYSKGYFLKGIPETSLSPHYRDVSRLSAAFALLSDATMLTYGGSLKQKESITALMSDMIGTLYLASAVLKYHQAEGSKDDLPQAQWSLQYCLYHFQQAFFEVLRHFQSKILAFKIRVITFPFGASYQTPDHTLISAVSNSMLSPSAFREKLKAQFMTPDSNIDLVEEAFQARHEVTAIRAKLQEAINTKQIHRKSPIKEQLKMALNFNILTQIEVDQYLVFWEKYWQAINVDDFEVL
jgi:acyl-CoA dehydrogenase